MYIVIYSVYQDLADGSCGLLAVCETLENAKETMKKDYQEKLVESSLCQLKTSLWVHPNGLSASLDQIETEKADHWCWKIEEIKA